MKLATGAWGCVTSGKLRKRSQFWESQELARPGLRLFVDMLFDFRVAKEVEGLRFRKSANVDGKRVRVQVDG